jgi:hypothetical protein
MMMMVMKFLQNTIALIAKWRIAPTDNFVVHDHTDKDTASTATGRYRRTKIQSICIANLLIVRKEILLLQLVLSPVSKIGSIEASRLKKMDL